MLRSLTYITIAALLACCAKPPHLELDAAEYMVGRAYAMQAMEFAPAEYEAAKTALQDAREAIMESSYSEARDSLDFALQHARRAVAISREGQAKQVAEEEQRAKAEEEARLAALRAPAEEKPVQQKKPQPQHKSVSKPKTETKHEITPATNYKVGEGENLWTISAQAEVYGEGLLWPLLYQANRDQIKDPRKIFPGQTLNIRRDMTQNELEDARQKARESDIFPVSAGTEPRQ